MKTKLRLPKNKTGLVIGDIHCPAVHPKYLSFCKKVYKEEGCDFVVFIGDVNDYHNISFHDPETMAPGVHDEYLAAKKEVAKWYRAFPDAFVCEGNHDKRVKRLAAKSKIPEYQLKTFNELFNTPKWVWAEEFMIDGVSYVHGDTLGSGLLPAYTKAKQFGHSIVAGHFHARAGVQYCVTKYNTVFGMQVGCGVDISHPSMSYQKNYVDKPVLSCGVVRKGKEALLRFM